MNLYSTNTESRIKFATVGIMSYTLRFRSLPQAYKGSHTLICPEVRLFHAK